MTNNRTPDPTTPARLEAAGFCVLPLESHKKHALFKWSEDIRGKGRAFANAFFQDKCATKAATTTGWALLPKHYDDPRLVILDVDAYDTAQADVEATLYGEDTDPPEGHTVARSPSGGLHFYYRLPEDLPPKRLPTEFALSSDVKGEMRVSGERNNLVVLPGSVVLNKKGKLGRYELVSGDILNPPYLPESLTARLLARVPATQDSPKDGRLPTEAEHLLDTIGYIPDGSVKHGTWNVWISRVGEMLGRIWARDRPDDGTVNRFWSAMQPKFDMTTDTVEPDNFSKILRSGYQTGRKNAESYGPRDKHPTETDLRAEIQGVCGGPIWLTENLSQENKREGFTLGFGGSAKRPHEAKKTAEIKSLSDVVELLGLILRITDADPDEFSRSPLMVQPGWQKQLKVYLLANREQEWAGIPLLTALQIALENAGLDALRNGHIGWDHNTQGCPTEDGRNRRAVATSAWWYVNGADVTLMLGTALVDDMARDYGTAGRNALRKDLGLKEAKGFAGVSGQKAHSVMLRDMPDAKWKAAVEAEILKQAQKRSGNGDNQQ